MQAKAEARVEVDDSEAAVGTATRSALCPHVEQQVTEGPMPETEAKPPVMDEMTKAYAILLVGDCQPICAVLYGSWGLSLVY